MATKKTKASTKRIEFFKYNPVTDGEQTFNIDLALNENWDKTADELERLDVAIENVDVMKPIQAHNIDPTSHADLRNSIKALESGKVKYVDFGVNATNPNDITETGEYRCTKWNTTQLPTGQADGQGLIKVMTYNGEQNGSAWFKQWFTSPHTGKTYERSKINTAWKEWTACNDGGNADTLDGKHASEFLPTTASCNKNWNWAGQAGQPSWLWGGNDPANMYVYNPSNFSVANSARLGGYTVAEVAKMGGDVMNKTFAFELLSLQIPARDTTEYTVKSYTNTKGGFVKLLTSPSSYLSLSVIVDGVKIIDNVTTGVLTGVTTSYGSSYSTAVFEIEIPFSSSFVMTVTSSSSSIQNFTGKLHYYINK